jgi:hypothetical protein
MKKVIAGLIFVGLLCAVNSFAADLSCNGTVTSITYGYGGEVYINTSFRTDTIRLCSVEYEWQDAVGEKTCALWARTVNDAVALGKQIRVKYSDTTYTCDTLPTWGNSIVPEYVRLYN